MPSSASSAPSCASCSFTDGSISLELQRNLQRPCTYGYLADLVLRDSSLRRDGLDFASLALALTPTLALASISTLPLPLPLPSRLAFLRIKVTLTPLRLRFAAPFDFCGIHSVGVGNISSFASSPSPRFPSDHNIYHSTSACEPRTFLPPNVLSSIILSLSLPHHPSFICMFSVVP